MVVVERGDGARLRPLLATLLRLRVAVYVLQLPSASQPEDELRLLGWSQAQGIFTKWSVSYHGVKNPDTLRNILDCARD